MKMRAIIVLSLISSFTLFPTASFGAEPTRDEIIATYHAQWDVQWEALRQRIVASEKKAALDPAVAKMYKTTVLEFLGADATIKQNLASASMDLTGLSAYAQEEYEEYTSYIYNVERAIKAYKTITCIKGSKRTVVTNSSPKCPVGYKKK